MNTARFSTSFTAGALAALLGTVAIASAYPGQHLSSQATIDIAHARSIALHTVRGTIASEELEHEQGGSGLRYTFDIKTTHGVREVGVDAKTGAVLENSAESTSAQGDGDGETGD